MKFNEFLTKCVNDSISGGSDLSRLTDAHVRALLDPPGCAGEDFGAAHDAGLVRMKWGRLEHTDEGRRALTEAQRIADGLSPRQAASLAAVARHPEGDVIMASSAAVDFVVRDLARLTHRGDDRDLLHITPLGRLVLALHERRKLEREAGPRLPDADPPV